MQAFVILCLVVSSATRFVDQHASPWLETPVDARAQAHSSERKPVFIDDGPEDDGDAGWMYMGEPPTEEIIQSELRRSEALSQVGALAKAESTAERVVVVALHGLGSLAQESEAVAVESEEFLKEEMKESVLDDVVPVEMVAVDNDVNSTGSAWHLPFRTAVVHGFGHRMDMYPVVTYSAVHLPLAVLSILGMLRAAYRRSEDVERGSLWIVVPFVVVWFYFTSVYATETLRALGQVQRLMGDQVMPDSTFLGACVLVTSAPFFVAAAFVGLLVWCRDDMRTLFGNMWRCMLPLGFFFYYAQGFTVKSIGHENVALQFSVKALEPLIAAVLTAVALPSAAQADLRMVLGVGLICAGSVAACFPSGVLIEHDAESLGIVGLGALSSFVFAARDVFNKREMLLRTGPMGPPATFLCMCTMGALAALSAIVLEVGASSQPRAVFGPVANALLRGDTALCLLSASAAFIAYGMASVTVLRVFTPAGHSLFGAFERTAVILAAQLAAGTPLDLPALGAAAMLIPFGAAVFRLSGVDEPLARSISATSLLQGRKPEKDNPWPDRLRVLIVLVVVFVDVYTVLHPPGHMAMLHTHEKPGEVRLASVIELE